MQLLQLNNGLITNFVAPLKFLHNAVRTAYCIFILSFAWSQQNEFKKMKTVQNREDENGSIKIQNSNPIHA